MSKAFSVGPFRAGHKGAEIGLVFGPDGDVLATVHQDEGGRIHGNTNLLAASASMHAELVDVVRVLSVWRLCVPGDIADGMDITLDKIERTLERHNLPLKA